MEGYTAAMQAPWRMPAHGPYVYRYVLCTALLFLGGIGISIWVFLALVANDRQLTRARFQDGAEHAVQSVKFGLDHGMDVVEDAGLLFDAMGVVNRDQFRTFTKPLIAHAPGLESLIWVPRVPAAQRATFEQSAQAAFPGYSFSEFVAPGVLTKARQRAEYLPNYYREGKGPVGRAMGFDHGSSPSRMEALSYARDNGGVSVSARVVPIEKQFASQIAFLVFRPVYAPGASPATVDQRRKANTGFLLGVMLADQLISGGLDRFVGAGLEVLLYDYSAAPGDRFLAVWPPRKDIQKLVRSDEPEPAEALQIVNEMEVGGRTWRMWVRATGGEFSLSPSIRSWATLWTGVLLTLLLVMYMGSLYRHDLRMREQAVTDALTGLHNRRYLWEFLQRELTRARRTGRPLAVIMVDVDHFKRINDTFGHEAGDIVLARLGEMLRASIRGSDVACRYGGEEFALLLSEIRRDEVLRRAESLRSAIEELKVVHRGMPVVVTASLGIALFPDDASDADGLLREADDVLYEAKRDGRNCVRVASAHAAADAPQPSNISAPCPVSS